MASQGRGRENGCSDSSFHIGSPSAIQTPVFFIDNPAKGWHSPFPLMPDWVRVKMPAEHEATIGTLGGTTDDGDHIDDPWPRFICGYIDAICYELTDDINRRGRGHVSRRVG